MGGERPEGALEQRERPAPIGGREPPPARRPGPARIDALEVQARRIEGLGDVTVLQQHDRDVATHVLLACEPDVERR